jgi:23S rRNA (adenine2503-C2)-methyltransferase
MPDTVNLLDFDLDRLGDWLVAQGEKRFRAQQVLRWIHQAGAADVSSMSDLAKTLRSRLQACALISPPLLIDQKRDRDGVIKFLFSVGSGNAIETVFIPEPSRGTLCISTQAGCALACTFCATGKQGFNRNLTTAEIIGQLWQVNQILGGFSAPSRLIDNVVLMGMGEPLANFDQLVPALRLMLDDHAWGLSRRRVTVSTAGIVPAIDRLRETLPVALAVSLHAPDDSLRDRLVPINRKYPLATLLAACERYLDAAPRDFITFEYTLIEAVNDSPEQARALLQLLKSIPSKINLIPFNPFQQSAWKRPSAARIEAFKNILLEAGFITTVRKTRGAVIDAACGQLAGDIRDKTRRNSHHTQGIHIGKLAPHRPQPFTTEVCL